MQFANDIMLVDERKEGVTSKPELWRNTLKFKGSKLSRSKTK